jgi:PAS domain S-box-containing protein
VSVDNRERDLAEEKFRLVVEACPSGMVLVDAGGRMIMVNTAIEEEFGYRREDIIGQSIYMLVPDRLRTEYTQRLEAVSRAPSPLRVGANGELTGLRKNRTEFPMEVGITQIDTSTGRLVLAVIVDISERKDTQQHLVQMESKYRSLVEAAPDSMVVLDQMGEIVFVNMQAERQFGYIRDALLGQNVTEIIPIGLAEKLLTVEPWSPEAALAPQIAAGFELVGRRKDASEFPAEIILSPLENSDKILIAAVIRDISPRKAAETHLIHMESMYRGLLEAAPDAIVVVNQAGDIILVNLQAENRFGYRRDELLGRKVTDIIEDFSDRLIAQVRRPTDDPLGRQIGTGIELQGRQKDGVEFPIEIMLSPLASSEGVLVTAAIRDISARKRVERLKDEFVSTVSHELRTPMTSIAGSLGLLVGHWASTLPESAARLLAIAQKNSQRLVRLINDILDIEKLEAGRVVFNLALVDVTPLVKQTIEANRGFAEAYGVHVRFEAKSLNCEVRADADRLAQVVTNLLSNAIKFSPAYEKVLVTTERIGEVVRVLVRDHGHGIPAEFKPHVFEKFGQADATNTRQKGGTGLGLSIVKQIVERMHGEVGFADAPGGGTLFFVDLPTWSDSTGWEIDLLAEPGSSRILLCEPDRETAAAMQIQLHQCGFATDLAFTLAAARARAEADDYDAVVLDLDLRDGDGINAILSLREQSRYKDTPIVVVSDDPALWRHDHRVDELNVLSCFSKPINLQQLVLVLATSIASETHKRPCILHLDDDRNVLSLVAHAFGTVADVISVETIKNARQAITNSHIDIALLDLSLGTHSGLELLPDLRDNNGHPIPVIILSVNEIEMPCDGQVQGVLTKSQASLKSLVEVVCERLTHRSGPIQREVA